MKLTFPFKNIMHNIKVKFSPATLPDAKKPFNLRLANQVTLDVKGVAGKADAYNVDIDPDVLIRGFNAAMELMFYLAADGYRIKTPFFSLYIRVPGEYEGIELDLPEDVSPKIRLLVSSLYRNYIKEKVTIEIDGKDQSEGFIALAVDEKTKEVKKTATRGQILTIMGQAIKIEAEPGNERHAGLFFVPESGAVIKAEVIAINEPRSVKAVVPATLEEGKAYHLVIDTWSSTKRTGTLLKNMREISSTFTITAC